MDIFFFGNFHGTAENFLVSVVVVGHKVSGVQVLDFCGSLEFLVYVDIALVRLREVTFDVNIRN